MFALLLWAFALYGVIAVLGKLVSHFLAAKKRMTINRTIVLAVKNAESYVEGVLRSLIKATALQKGEVRLLVIDAGSHDATGPIVQRLAAQHEIIEWREMKEWTLEENFPLRDVGETPHVFVCLDLRQWEAGKALSYVLRLLGEST